MTRKKKEDSAGENTPDKAEMRKIMLDVWFRRADDSKAEKRAGARVLKYLEEIPANELGLKIHEEFVSLCRQFSSQAIADLQFWTAFAEGLFGYYCIYGNLSEPKTYDQRAVFTDGWLRQVMGIHKWNSGKGNLRELISRDKNMLFAWKEFLFRAGHTATGDIDILEHKMFDYSEKHLGVVWALFLVQGNLVLFYHPALSLAEAAKAVRAEEGWMLAE